MHTQTGSVRLVFRRRQRWQWLAWLLAVGLVSLGASACGGIQAIPDARNPVVYGLAMLSENDGWAVGGEDSLQQQAMIAHYQNGSWTPVTMTEYAPALYSIFMLSASDGWAVGRYGTILHYDRSTWSSVDSPTKSTLNSVFMASPDDGWAVGTAILHYDGSAWNLVGGSTPQLNSVYMFSTKEGWAVGDGGLILHYQGTGWEPVPSPSSSTPTPETSTPTPETSTPTPETLTSNALTSVRFTSLTEGWAVGDDGTFLHFHAGVWSDESLKTSNGSTDDMLTAVSLVSPWEGWAVGRQVTSSGTNGLIYHYTGGKWVQVTSPTHSTWNALEMLSPNLGWTGGSGGNLLEYADGKWC